MLAIAVCTRGHQVLDDVDGDPASIKRGLNLLDAVVSDTEAEEMIVDGVDGGSEAGSVCADILDKGVATPVAGESSDEAAPTPPLRPPADPEKSRRCWQHYRPRRPQPTEAEANFKKNQTSE